MISWFDRKSFRQKISILVTVFLAGISIFAAIYWIAWLWSPDSFIVQEEVNVFPISELRALLDLYNPHDISQYISYAPEGLDDVYPDVEQVKQKLVEIEAEIARVTKLSDSQWQQLNSVREVLDQDSYRRFDQYLEEEMRELWNRERNLAAEIERIEALIDENSDPGYSAELSLQATSLKVDLAQLRAEIAKKQAQLHLDYFENREKFLNPELLSTLNELADEQLETERQLLEARGDFLDLRLEIWDVWWSARQRRVVRLGFVDFLYFSLTVSAGNAFGDILPNQSLVRFLVVVQMLLSLLWVGIAVWLVTERIKAQG